MGSRARPTTDISAHKGSRVGAIEIPDGVLERRVPAHASAPVQVPGAQPAKRHEVVGLVVLTAATMLALALASYDARSGRNWCGPTGHSVAELLVALLGTAAVLIPWALIVVAVRLFRRTEHPVRLARALGTAVIVGTIATALHLAFGERPMLGHLPSGGLIGITAGELLRSLVGTAGAHLVVLAALLVSLVVRTRLSVVSFALGARRAGVKSSIAAKEGIVTVAKAWRQAREEEQRAGDATDTHDVPRIVAPEERTESALAEVFQTHHDEPFESEDDAAAPSSPNAADSWDQGARAGIAALLADTGNASATPAPAATPARRRAPKSVAAPAPAPIEEPADEPAPAPKRPSRPPPRKNAPSDAVENPAPAANEPVVSAPEIAVTAPAAPPPLPKATSKRAQAPAVVAPPAPPPPAVEEPELSTNDGASDEESDEDDAVEEPSPPAVQKLQIVSHDRESQAAMKSATGAVEAHAPPPVSVKIPTARPIEMPGADLLTAAPRDGVKFDENQLRAAADRLIKTLNDYTIDGRVVEIHPGPVVTTYEFVPAAGTKLAKIARLSDDIAMSLEANKVRIVAPIPGKGRVGFEIPNTKRQTVYFRELIETEAFKSLGGAMPVAFGKDVVGAPYFADLATMPHLIVAGATGAGKSVGLNVMLTSLLYKRTPEDVRLLMIDPKMVELAVYDGIPHMLLPVVTDMKKAALALRWVVDEMERRYTLFAQTGARNITTYNERIAKALADGTTPKGLNGPVRTKESGTTMEIREGEGAEGENAAPPPPPKVTKLPYILVVVDEFADLMMVAGKDVESAVARLAQKARAAGIHVILATQRPSVDVITGVIKANFPSRVAFKVSQKVDSRTILDQQGAEHLLGRGDMLILPPGSSDLRRVHCAFVSEDEVQAVTDHWRKQGTPTYDEEILRPRDEEDEGGAEEPDIKVPQEKYEKAVALVLSSRRCSVSWVQRQLAVGYNVAARMVEKMERDGIVGAPKGPGKDREVLG